jgi:hypothetical protein
VIKKTALLPILLLLSACAGGPPPSPTVGPIDHPIGATELVLRMESGGGFVPMGFLVSQGPQFSLYGDGTVIYQQADTRNGDPFGGQALLPYLVGHLDEAAVQDLLDFALNQGALAAAGEFYPARNVADAPDTIFTVNSDGQSKRVSVGALGMEDPSDPDMAIRQRFSQLAEALGSFEERGQNGELGDIKPYDAEKYRVVLLETFGEPAAQPQAWPWDDVSPDDFVALAESGWQEAVLDREHVALLLELPTGGHAGIWVSAPNGTVVQLGIRPLLPDEEKPAV